jgi:hypothetical protein
LTKKTNLGKCRVIHTMNKVFPVELEEDLHRRMKHAAIDAGLTLHEWIIKTLREKLGMDGEPEKRSVKNEHHRRHN